MGREEAISRPMRSMLVVLGFGTVLLGVVACGRNVGAQPSGFGPGVVDDTPASSSGSCFCESDARGVGPDLPDASSGDAETDAQADASGTLDAAAD